METADKIFVVAGWMLSLWLPFLLAVSANIWLEPILLKIVVCTIAFVGLSVVHMLLPLRKG